MSDRTATIIADLGFGDGSKGATVDFLARQRPIAAVIRFSGGGQAAHNVVTPDGTHHVFAQFGSATFVPGVRTHLSRFMLVDPVALFPEARHLKQCGCGNPFDRLTVDADALVVTPFHKAANRLREAARGAARHGSCGMGIGEAMADRIADPDSAVFVRDLRNRPVLARKLQKQLDAKRQLLGALPSLTERGGIEQDIALLEDPAAAATWTAALTTFGQVIPIVSGDYLRTLAQMGDLLFEGSQGVLIDEWHGFHPYTTWSTTTFANALTLLQEIGYDGRVERLGALRAHFVRHGAGPFPTETPSLGPLLPDHWNGTGRWQGAFRVGWLDLVLARYALAVCGGVDGLAISHLDQFHQLATPLVNVAYDVPRAVAFANAPAAVFRDHGDAGCLRVTELKLKSELTDLSHQEALTALLAAARPVYHDSPADSESYLTLLERELGVPITLTAYGPTASDRQLRIPAVAALAG